jgi:hypothetical protein
MVLYIFILATIVSSNVINCTTPQTELLTQKVAFRLKEQSNKIFDHLKLYFTYTDMVIEYLI